MDSHMWHHDPDSAETERDIRLVREAMDRGTDALEPPADLLRGVLVIGHRKRVRAACLALMGTGLGVAVLAVGGFLVITPSGTSTTGPAARGSGAPTTLARENARIEVVSRPSPTVSISVSGTGVPSRSPEERSWADDYRRRVAETLRDLLPSTIGRVRIIEG